MRGLNACFAREHTNVHTDRRLWRGRVSIVLVCDTMDIYASKEATMYRYTLRLRLTNFYIRKEKFA